MDNCNSEPIIEKSGYAVIVDNITKNFDSFTAVDNISFNVKKGEIFGFLGANGAGKTTTIRMLCGLLMPSSGQATISGYDIYKEVSKIKSIIGYMSQKFSLYPDLTVNENIQFYGGIYGLTRQSIKEKTEQLLRELNLQEYSQNLAGLLPLGLKQRLALSIAILHNPKIVFLDEPTSGVDPEARREFWLLIHRLAHEGKTIFVSTHNMDEAEYCHKIGILKAGKIIAQDTPDKLKTEYQVDTIQNVFLAIAGLKR
ncbi:ABC transporter ATP-binding protein [Candidatus Margulisiibacteriota bacterium]